MDMAGSRARGAPARLRGAAAFGWARRWSRMLSVACATAMATSLTAPPRTMDGQLLDGPTPALSDVLGSLQ
eukprot:6837842-Karenia_brevis.AAC.1